MRQLDDVAILKMPAAGEDAAKQDCGIDGRDFRVPDSFPRIDVGKVIEEAAMRRQRSPQKGEGRDHPQAVVAGAWITVAAQVSPSRLATQATADGNWLIYSGAYTSQRFSPLDQISSSNVGRLKPLWAYQPPGVGSLEGTPVVADGVMYVTSAPASVAL